jgi:predicted RNase H-like nuclease (RuvC/YqgF family)
MDTATASHSLSHRLPRTPQELARKKRSLQEDVRRFGVALDQMNTQLSVAQSTIDLRDAAFEKLKKEVGKPKDFKYPDLVLEQEMMGDNARLQAQLSEAENQIEDLERENMRVRDAMMNMAGSIGEQGFRFYGMDVDMLEKVNAYAKSLKEGIDKVRPCPVSPASSPSARMCSPFPTLFSTPVHMH